MTYQVHILLKRVSSATKWQYHSKKFRGFNPIKKPHNKASSYVCCVNQTVFTKNLVFLSFKTLPFLSERNTLQSGNQIESEAEKHIIPH